MRLRLHVRARGWAQWGVEALERIYGEEEVRRLLWSASDNADGRRDELLLCADLAAAWRGRPVVGFKAPAPLPPTHPPTPAAAAASAAAAAVFEVLFLATSSCHSAICADGVRGSC